MQQPAAAAAAAAAGAGRRQQPRAAGGLPGSWVVGVAVLVAAGAFSLGREALPALDEPAPKYGRRLFKHIAQKSEDLYVSLLLALPGGPQARVGPGPPGGGPDVAVGPTALEAQDRLKQEVATSFEEIDAQQQVSVKRYVEARKEAAAAAGGAEPLVLPEHPDEVRNRMPPVRPDGPEMRCGKDVASESVLVTRNIELRARAIYVGHDGEEFSWKYVITFRNLGSETVQMLTRHWVFVDVIGAVWNEVKGPGARGVTPVLPPGAEWGYESGTSLPTQFGSMHGSFQFEVLKGDTGPGQRFFSARVGRLLLSKLPNDRRQVPCASEEALELLPLTAVLATDRVILGGSASRLKVGKAEKRAAKAAGGSKGKYTFMYDVQFNNARDAEIEIVGHSWTVVDARGRRTVVAEGPGVGGSVGRSRRLAAGDAFRVQGTISSDTQLANAEGTYRVIIRADDGTFREIEARTDYMGLSADPDVRHVPNFVEKFASVL